MTICLRSSNPSRHLASRLLLHHPVQVLLQVARRSSSRYQHRARRPDPGSRSSKEMRTGTLRQDLLDSGRSQESRTLSLLLGYLLLLLGLQLVLLRAKVCFTVPSLSSSISNRSPDFFHPRSRFDSRLHHRCQEGWITAHFQDSFQDRSRPPGGLDLAGIKEGKGEGCSS